MVLIMANSYLPLLKLVYSVKIAKGIAVIENKLNNLYLWSSTKTT